MNKTTAWSIGAFVVLLGTGLFAAHAQMMGGWTRAAAVDGDTTQGGHIADTQCAACHGKDGNSPVQQFPKLAGQRATYLDTQLQAFKDGDRASDTMRGIAAKLSSADMADVAAYYAEQTEHPDAASNSALVDTGERIFLNGTNGAPACAMCHGSGRARGMHGMMGGGMMGGGMMMGGSGVVPRLNGQHAAYLVDQLNRYASGARANPTMQRIAAALSDSERQAVAAYLAQLR